RSMSDFDRLAILTAYPAAVAEQDTELQRRGTVAAAALAELDLDPDQVALAGGKLAIAMSHVTRPLRIQLLLTNSDVVIRSSKRSKLKSCGQSALKADQTSKVI